MKNNYRFFFILFIKINMGNVLRMKDLSVNGCYRIMEKNNCRFFVLFNQK